MRKLQGPPPLLNKAAKRGRNRIRVGTHHWNKSRPLLVLHNDTAFSGLLGARPALVASAVFLF